MAKRFDVVLVKFQEGTNVYAFEAPEFSRIEKGDEVIVDSLGKEKRGTAVAVKHFNMNYDDEEFYFVVAAVRASLPLKRVIAKFTREDMKYEEENEDE